MTDEQENFVNSILDYNVTICNAPAGSGKTLMAVAAAKYLFESGVCKDGAVYIFSPCMEGEMGHRPGDQKEKEYEYTYPLQDALSKLNENPQYMEKEGYWIEAKSHTFLRGTNIENKTIIIDEAQNFTVDQLKKTISRVHDNCHLVVIGHTGQIDLKKKSQSGFDRVIEVFGQDERVKVCKLTKNFRGWISQLADQL